MFSRFSRLLGINPSNSSPLPQAQRIPHPSQNIDPPPQTQFQQLPQAQRLPQAQQQSIQQPQPQPPPSSQPKSPSRESPPPSPSLDPDDLYYFISSNIGQSIGPYVPQREDQINDIARTEGTNSKTFITVIPGKPLDIRKAGPERSSYTTWTPSKIPNTNATGWVSQNLNGRFAVRVAGKARRKVGATGIQ